MMNLTEANVGEDYIVKDIVSDDEELKSFLFSLGCYSGEPVTVVSRKKMDMYFLLRTQDITLIQILQAQLKFELMCRLIIE